MFVDWIKLEKPIDSMYKKIVTGCCLSLALCSGGEAIAQLSYTTAPLEQWYDKGKTMFEQQNYVGCQDMLTYFLENSTNTQLGEEAHYMIATSAYEQGASNTMELLQAFLKTYPTSIYNTEVQFNIANAYFFEEKYQLAINNYTHVDIDKLAVERQPDLLYRQGLSYLYISNYTAATPCFESLLSKPNPHQEAASYYLAYIDYTNGEYAKASRTLSSLQESEEFGEAASYLMAQIYFTEQRYSETITLATALLEKYPNNDNNLELNRIIGASYYYEGNNEQAIAYLTTYTDSCHAPMRDNLYMLGVAYYRTSEWQKAVDALSRATEGGDELTQNSYLYLGQCYLKLDDKTRARLAFEQSAQYNFDKQVNETALYNYALSIHETAFSPFDESVVVFERFLNEYPTSRYADQINDYLVEVYLTTHNYEAALASIAKIKQPTTKVLAAKQRLLFQLGTEYFINGKIAEAEEQFTQAITFGNYDSEAKALAYFWRGECNYRDGYYSKAATAYQEYISSTPNKEDNTYPLAIYSLGYANFKQQKFGAAQQQFLNYIKVAPAADKKNIADAYNRIGDCYFSQRNFAQAQVYYGEAATVRPQSCDYAMFQKAQMMGLQQNLGEKVTTLDNLIAQYPQSEYIDDALYEKGLALNILNRDNEAIAAFESVMKQFPQSSLARKSGLQLGIVYFNNNQSENATVAYKRVIETFPGSQEAKVAAEDLKSIYLDKNDIDGYAAYIKTLNGSIVFNATEQDSLTYLAAEKVFLDGNQKGGATSFHSYLQNYPQGAFVSAAHYYLGRYYYDQKTYDIALDHLETILTQPDSPYAEESLMRVADIYTKKGELNAALYSYQNLDLRASTTANKLLARANMLRINNQLEQYTEVVIVANKLLETSQISPELEAEALLKRGLALLTLKQGDKAVGDFEKVSKETRTEFGAEGAYRLAQYYFDNNQSEKAEESLNTFIATGTSHQYWLARAFVLLADIYIAQDDMFQAKQYLLSLKSNYQGDDDIASKIAERLTITGE